MLNSSFSGFSEFSLLLLGWGATSGSPPRTFMQLLSLFVFAISNGVSLDFFIKKL